MKTMKNKIRFIATLILIDVLFFALGVCASQIYNLSREDASSEKTIYCEVTENNAVSPTYLYSPDSRIINLTNFSTQEFNVSAFSLYVMNFTELNRVFHEEYNGSSKHWVAGFMFQSSRKIYVGVSNQLDRNNKSIPNLETLGHELWHEQELGDIWHK